MPKLLTALLILLFTAPAFAGTDKLMSDEQKTLYSIGQSISMSLYKFALTPEELDLVLMGIRDRQAGKAPQADPAVYAGRIWALANERRKIMTDRLAPANRELLDKAAREKGAVKSDSGVIFIPLREGTGPSPAETDTLSVNYRGTLADGTEFDNSYKRGKPLEFKLNGIIPCWSEGLRNMKAGGKARLVCPAKSAYGDTGSGEVILPGANLDFEVELIEVRK